MPARAAEASTTHSPDRLYRQMSTTDRCVESECSMNLFHDPGSKVPEPPNMFFYPITLSRKGDRGP